MCWAFAANMSRPRNTGGLTEFQVESNIGQSFENVARREPVLAAAAAIRQVAACSRPL